MTSVVEKIRILLRSRMKDAVQSLLAPDLVLRPATHFHRLETQRDQLFLALLEQSPKRPGKGVHGIAFSKDRPLQLDGLIRSYFALVSNPAPLTVLFRATTPEYAAAYAELEAGLLDQPVRFVPETRFQEDLIRILSSIEAGRLFFLVDDDLFIRKFDLKDIEDVDPAQTIFSMRLGLNLDYCYTVAQSQATPRHSILANGMVSWRWCEGVLDWAFPLSVDGHVLATDDILLMTRVSEINGPNTFEFAMHSFVRLYADRLGLCYPTGRLVNIPANKVQAESANIAGAVSSDWLLGRWQDGYRLDWVKLLDFSNRSVHQEIELPLALAK